MDSQTLSSEPISPNIFTCSTPEILKYDFNNKITHLHVHGSLMLVNDHMTCRYKTFNII